MELYDLLKQLVESFDKHKVPYALCGGLAMAVHAFPRATMDVDLLIEEQTLETARIAAREVGFTKDIGWLKLKQGEVRIYRLTRIDADLGDDIKRLQEDE